MGTHRHVPLLSFLCFSTTLIHHTPTQDSKFNLTLLKGEKRQQACLLYTNGKNIVFHNWEEQIPCHLRRTNNNRTFAFTIFKLDVNHTDIYRCQINILRPAPYINRVTNETYVYIHGPSTMPDFADYISANMARRRVLRTGLGNTALVYRWYSQELVHSHEMVEVMWHP
uniref:Immunoglobulin V-set domain-containing protein n=1 Tax=Leptobrachium leishanense TaxID=445787 RepID=A0A8C5PE38_9ANUR